MSTPTDVQTDVHIVPVDSESPTRKLATTLIYQCKWCSYLAQTYTLAAPFFLLKKLDKTASVNVMVMSLCCDWAHIGRYNLFFRFTLISLIENFCNHYRGLHIFAPF